MTRTYRWEPLMFDDHGQPLCDTEEEEQQLFDALFAAGPTSHDISCAVDDAVHDLTTRWELDPTDNLAQTILWIEIAEYARRTVINELGALANYEHLHPTTWHHISDKTGLTTSHLEATYPPAQEPRF